MTRRRLDTYEGNAARVGDVVFVRGVVVKVIRSEEIEVRFWSKTTEYTEVIRTDHCEIDLPELGVEPPNGTILTCRSEDGVEYVFKRDDAEGHNDRGTRRHDRRWWSYVDQTWVDWADVVRLGGLGGQILTPNG